MTSRTGRTLALAAGILLMGCRGSQRAPSENEALQHTIDSLVPLVEQATGLSFKRHPRGEMIDREEASAYIARQIERQLGGGRGEKIGSVYRLLGLLPDSIDLRTLEERVLAEQVAGFYDPERDRFFGVRGNPVAMRLLISHELVHALQHDYVPLDSLMNARDNADHLLAAHALLEGQATLASTRLNPDAGDRVLDQEFWELARAQAEGQLRSMPMLAAAPRLVREEITFPYFDGATYVAWWMRHHAAGVMPYGAALPRSSEQILAPDRVAAGDAPVALTIDGPAPAYTDVLGAEEMRILLAAARGQDSLVDPAVLGWGGDRFALYDAGGKPALVWYAVFDTPGARNAMYRALASWPPSRAGYRSTVDTSTLGRRAGLRLVVAPLGWNGWTRLPRARSAAEPLADSSSNGRP